MAYPTIGESVLLSTGFQWIVIDEDPLVVAFASGGGGRDISKKKTLFSLKYQISNFHSVIKGNSISKRTEKLHTNPSPNPTTAD